MNTGGNIFLQRREKPCLFALMSKNDDAPDHASKLRVGPFTIASGALAATSLFSLAQRLRDFGLSPVVADFVTYYRIVADRFFGWLTELLNLRYPELFTDLWMLSFVGAGVLVRLIAAFPRLDDYGFYQSPLGRCIAWVFLGFIGAGLLATLMLPFSLLALAIAIFGSEQDYEEPIRQRVKEADEENVVFLKQVGIVIGFLLVLFGLNAYAPSV